MSEINKSTINEMVSKFDEQIEQASIAVDLAITDAERMYWSNELFFAEQQRTELLDEGK